MSYERLINLVPAVFWQIIPKLYLENKYTDRSRI
jgi:hypothetical protein